MGTSGLDKVLPAHVQCALLGTNRGRAGWRDELTRAWIREASMRDASDHRLFRSRIAQLIALGRAIATAARNGATAAPSDRCGITLRLPWLSRCTRQLKR